MTDLSTTGPYQPATLGEAAAAPERISRYRIEKILGEGGFGRVYLAHDEQLQRLVAIKVPHGRHVSRPEDAEAYLAEARIAANLDHPNIVPVHDVGSTERFPCYIVSKFIEGSTLARKIKGNRLSVAEAVELTEAVAEALHYAHKQGVFHRDIKPGNILLDPAGKPYITDFGVALREENVGRGPRYAGTPAYMSPEQARGEGHRVDGRSDIFTLGVIFYELLTGRRPFHADSRQELLERIANVEARPPRQWDDTIPKELERICLKALSQRASERYTTAKDFADDLRHFMEQSTLEEREALRSGVSAAGIPAAAFTCTPAPSSVPTSGESQQLVKIVPKGLRSFDSGDADFYLELLPGPQDRDGLPDSIRFWKSRIETTDADRTFEMGLIYGPSGCGKSSLVKAGLLPRLAQSVTAVYVETTGDETEARVLKGLRRNIADLPGQLDLVESFAALRQGQSLPAGQKVLLILDQFEQWLHARRIDEKTELVQALRQCDGGRLQAIVMVRDDFWLAVSRFMQALEIVPDGENSRLVDLFDPRHAKKVLAAFGRAFGALPEKELRKDQKAFLDQAVTGLAQQGKVISVRLALFAEMAKGKPWTPTTLKEVGGTEGVGVTFLEETFAASTAPPQHRLHQKAAQAVLNALLPETGSDIKGHMKSYAALLEVSGYGSRPKDFNDLIRILDSEIRLITPTDPEGKETIGDSTAHPGQKYYQLTHDYLVHSLRDWLTRKQKETRRGRAELRLSERAALWSSRPENRHLPAWWEWAVIRGLTRKQDWTASQRKMMRKASRHHGVRAFALVLLLAVATGIGLRIRTIRERVKERSAAGLVQSLLNADIAQVPWIIASMSEYRQYVDALLREENDKAAATSRYKLHTSLALLPVDDSQLTYLNERLLDAEAGEVGVLRDALLPHKDQLVGALWTVAEAPPKGKETQRLRAATALAKYDPESEKWARASVLVFSDLVRENPVHLLYWSEAFRPVKGWFVALLSKRYRDQRPEAAAERSLATNLLADYAADDPQVLADLLMDADDKQFAVLFPKLHGQQEKGQAFLLAELDIKSQPKWPDLPLDPAWKAVNGPLIQKIESAHGLFHERFAFCQMMPLLEFLSLAEQLRQSGYRPTRFRPYAATDGVQVAAVWARDNQEWQMAHGLSAVELQKRNAGARQQSFHPVDAFGYIDDGKEVYAALWLKCPPKTLDTQLGVSMTEKQLLASDSVLRKEGYWRVTTALLPAKDGPDRSTVIWSRPPSRKAPGPNDSTDALFVGVEAEYNGENYLADLQIDVQVSRALPPQMTKERYTRQLAEAEASLRANADNADARMQRALAHFNLGQNDKALQDFSWLICKMPNYAQAFQNRAIVQARMGNVKEARNDLARLAKLSMEADQRAYAEAIVSAYLGEDVEPMKRLETTLAANAKNFDFLYNSACAYAVASQALAGKDQTRVNAYGERAVALLKEAIANGYTNYSQIQTDPDLDPLRRNPGFGSLLQGGKVERHYAAVWHPVAGWTSTEVHGLDPVAHLARCRELTAQGYRPASFSVAAFPNLPASAGASPVLVTASVWHRPVVPDEVKEKLAKRQAIAAVALLGMERPERLWRLLRHTPDPRVRSYVIHRLSPLGADPRAILNRLWEEQEVSTRRALLLCLGEFDEKQFPPVERETLIPGLFKLYRQDPDPGIHGSVKWLLERWGQRETLQGIDKELSAKKSESGHDKSLGWYVNGQGQTFVIIPGPVEFLMGSPRTEEGREGGAQNALETLHKRRIGRTFALARDEVTVEQFLRFRRSHAYNPQHAPTSDCPVSPVTWYDAAAYCNWLSEQENIPKEQWCYQPNEQSEYAEKMKVKANFLNLTGYRLPTEAEWEYAARACASTARYYGETEELLGQYAWYSKNSLDRWMLPVGSRVKPNDWGLFDVYGNALEWCHDQARYFNLGRPGRAIEDQGAKEDIIDRFPRGLRGGSFDAKAVYARSAGRDRYAPTDRLNGVVGFRPARTLRP
jgi:serine/threonine protein kinase/formylglycine-generating enzyme required for sulfatase activity